MKIDWDYPEPRKGLLGYWDTFIGPGATELEIKLILGTAFFAGVGMYIYTIVGKSYLGLDWSVLKIIVAIILAMDLGGGVVANAAAPAKRWYHRKGQGFRKHFSFAAFHIYPILIGLWYRNLDWLYSLIIYGFLILSSVIILVIPNYVRRPVSFIILVIAILLNWYAFPPVLGTEWFIPVLFLKISVGHLVREEPYRPSKDVE